MTTGLAATTLANKWLDLLGGTAFTTPAGTWVQLHIADPGAAGTTSPVPSGANASIRKSVTWGAASGGSKAQTGTPSWTTWDAGNQTVSHISAWDAVGSGTPATGGNFFFSGALGTSKSLTNGDTFNLTSLSVALTPIAA